MRPSRHAWTALGGCLALIFFSYTYNDNVVISLHGMNVWSALADGRILDFYAYNDGVSPPDTGFHAVPIVYGFATFSVIAIWNLPLWLLQEVAGVNVFTSVLALGWMKAINVPFALGCAWLVQRISLRLAPASRWAPWAGFVVLSSGFLVSAVFVMGQFDAIHAFFTMLGLYFLVQGRRRAFVVAFAVALAIKWFPLFVFLPVLLLVEKRPSRILLSLAGALSLVVAFKLPFLFADNPSAEVGSSLMAAMVQDNRLPLGLEGVPVFPVLFALVCIACYVRRPASLPEMHRTAVYAAFAGVAAFFVSAPAYPYWFALICPLFAVMWAIDPARARVNLLIETGLTAAMLVLHQIHFYWTYDLGIVSPMILPRVFGSVESLVQPLDALGVYTRLGVVEYRALLAAVFTAGMVALLVLNRPRSDADLVVASEEDNTVDRTLVYGRAAVTVGLMLVPAAAYFYALLAHGRTG
ncbi:hypothetical protein [Nocardioides sp. LHG3406-4]|uniref:hypothetical protein n=1 Tax=Nocardioides sp. LHG3406-4 TaxID=2804575 RepID=UPI003CE9D629